MVAIYQLHYWFNYYFFDLSTNRTDEIDKLLLRPSTIDSSYYSFNGFVININIFYNHCQNKRLISIFYFKFYLRFSKEEIVFAMTIPLVRKVLKTRQLPYCWQHGCHVLMKEFSAKSNTIEVLRPILWETLIICAPIVTSKRKTKTVTVLILQIGYWYFNHSSVLIWILQNA